MVLSDIPESHSLYDMIFDRVVKDLTEYNSKMLDDLQQHLEKFVEFDAAKQEILREIAVFAVVNLAKNKKNKEFYDKLRSTLFAIVSTSANAASPADFEDIVAKTLPAFATIVNTALSKGEGDDQISATFKSFAKHSVDSQNGSSVKMLSIAMNNKAALKYTDGELKELVELYWADFKRKCTADAPEQSSRDSAKSTDLVLRHIFDFKSSDEWVQLLLEIELAIKEDEFNEKLNEHSRILSSMAKCQLNKAKGQIFSEFFRKTLFWIRINAFSKSAELAVNFDSFVHLLDCYTIFANNVQVRRETGRRCEEMFLICFRELPRCQRLWSSSTISWLFCPR